MSDYVICIPSYKRNEVCNERTLKTLHENKIDPKKIYVYVADKEDYKLYEETLDKNNYNNVLSEQQIERESSNWMSGFIIHFFVQNILQFLFPLMFQFARNK